MVRVLGYDIRLYVVVAVFSGGSAPFTNPHDVNAAISREQWQRLMKGTHSVCIVRVISGLLVNRQVK